jgi:hypothetical protein
MQNGELNEESAHESKTSDRTKAQAGSVTSVWRAACAAASFQPKKEMQHVP